MKLSIDYYNPVDILEKSCTAAKNIVVLKAKTDEAFGSESAIDKLIREHVTVETTSMCRKLNDICGHATFMLKLSPAENDRRVRLAGMAQKDSEELYNKFEALTKMLDGVLKEREES